MTRHEIKIPSPEHFEQYLLKKHNLKTNITKNKILISGKPRGSRKTTTVLDYLLNECSFLFYNEGQPGVTYVTRAIGTVEEKGNQGTFYDTERTIRRIEKESPNFQEKQLKICMIAGKAKTCSLYEHAKNIKYQKYVFCESCSYTKKLKKNKKNKYTKSNLLIEELNKISTLTPYKTKKLSEKYQVCRTAIIRYYLENVANIQLMTYAMIPHWESDLFINPIIYDEARHLIELPQINLVTIKVEKDKKLTVKEICNEVSKSFDSCSSEDINNENAPKWMNKYLLHIVERLSFFFGKKIYAMDEVEKEIEDNTFQNEFEEEERRSQYEYIGDYYPWIGYIHLPEEFINKLSSEDIHYLLENLVPIYFKKMPENEKSMLKKTIDTLIVLEQIAGCSFVEVEILKSPGLLNKKDTYSITLKPYKRIEIEQEPFVFFIDATPYPNKYYRYWFGTSVDNVILPDKTPITIVYEDAKKSTNQIYGHGDKVDQFIGHIELIKGVIDLCESKSLKYAVVARTKEVRSILEKQGINADMVCGDARAEGVQLDADVSIIEGTQIRNLGVDSSLRYMLGKILKKSPSRAFQQYQDINNSQQLIQTAFRAVDSNGKRKNIIIMLGNKMPHRNMCWVELGKKYWPWLKNDKIIKIKRKLSIDNKIKEIDMIISEKKTESKLSSFEEQIYQYIKGRNYQRVKKATCVKYFLSSNKVIRKTKSEIYKAIKKLVSLGYIKDEKGILSVLK